MEDDILTIEEVAKYLRVSDRTVYDWAQKGEIPAGKIGTVWRFKKSEVENWVNARLSSDSAKQAEQTIQVRNILSPDRIVFINQTTQHDALVQLADVLATAPQVKDGPELTQEILKREELMSTAIGRGIAIPHVRLSSVTDLAAAYNQHSYYLKTISHFSAKFKDKDLRDAMLGALNEKEVYDLLIKA